MTWAEFKTAVLDRLPVDDRRVGTENARDRWLFDAVRDLQAHVPAYRMGHTSFLSPSDLAPQGGAMLGNVPEGAELTDVSIVAAGQNCFRRPVSQWPWDRRQELLCMCVSSQCCQAYVAINPAGTQFILFPALTSGEQVELVYNATKVDFADTDVVPFGDEAALAISFYVKSFIEMRVNRDPAMALVYMNGPGVPGSSPGNYAYERKQLYVGSGERTHLPADGRQVERGVRETWCGMCVGADGVNTVELVAFGDSGEASTIADTEAVANMAKSIGANAILHLGDANYPSGETATMWDHFQKFYESWLSEGKWYQSWGNHDLLDSGGTAQDGWPLLEIMPWIAALNAGKLYYRKVVGPLELFVVNSGNTDLDPREPDGITVGSVQALWLQAALAENSGLWKVVVRHRAGVSSDITHTPGSVSNDWPLGAWGAHAALGGHGHNYERLSVDDVVFINAGTGGATLRNFEVIPEVESLVRIKAHGVVRIRATANELRFVFQDKTGAFRDSITLTEK